MADGAESVTHWINCKDMLPEHGQDVLVMVVCKNWKSSYPSDKYIITAWYCNEESDDDYDNYWCINVLTEWKQIDRKDWMVTHWMPLPRYPEAE